MFQTQLPAPLACRNTEKTSLLVYSLSCFLLQEFGQIFCFTAKLLVLSKIHKRPLIFANLLQSLLRLLLVFAVGSGEVVFVVVEVPPGQVVLVLSRIESRLRRRIRPPMNGVLHQFASASRTTEAAEAAPSLPLGSEDAGDRSSAGPQVCLAHQQLGAPRALLAWIAGFHRRAKAPATFNTSPPEHLKELPGLA